MGLVSKDIHIVNLFQEHMSSRAGTQKYNDGEYPSAASGSSPQAPLTVWGTPYASNGSTRRI